MMENKKVKCRSEIKLLGIAIKDTLSFNTHIETLYSTANNRLQALARTHKFLSFGETKRLSDAYIMSTFRCCPLMWMFFSKAASSVTRGKMRSGA